MPAAAALTNPYDELAYRSFPIEWTAPERLAVASVLHGGPRPRLSGCRTLELGCANGANLLPLANFRRDCEFVGVDGARTQIEIARQRQAELDLPNVAFIQADFKEARGRLSGQFDFIIAHGIFSWVTDEARDAVLLLAADHLAPGGLFYLNYNTFPGWKVRGMVRELLLTQTALDSHLAAKARHAQLIAAKLAASMALSDHPFSQLLGNELRFVSESDPSYVAHEFLAQHNRAYWRREFLELVSQHGFEYVADADFNYSSGRTSQEITPKLLREEDIANTCFEDVLDLVHYRQLHSPILTRGHAVSGQVDELEFAQLRMASCLAPCTVEAISNPCFEHPESGFQVEAKTGAMQAALGRLHGLWPRSLPVRELFEDIGSVAEDLRLLQRQGLVELRCIEPADFGVAAEPLNRLEVAWGGYVTTPHHTRVAVQPQEHLDTGEPRHVVPC